MDGAYTRIGIDGVRRYDHPANEKRFLFWKQFPKVEFRALNRNFVFQFYWHVCCQHVVFANGNKSGVRIKLAVMELSERMVLLHSFFRYASAS